MKNIIFITAFLLNIEALKAQNVGINTDGSLPTMMLHIKTDATNAPNGILIDNRGGAEADAIIQFQNAGTSEWTIGFDDSNGDRFIFDNGAALTTTNVISIEPNGDVGIGVNNPTALLTVNTDAIFNESGGSNDFRIESNNQLNQFFVDGSTDRIGIRTDTPTNMLQMTNNGVAVGANAMANFVNTGADGVSLVGDNTSTANVYNAIEGVTSGTNNGVMGIGLTTGAGGPGTTGSTNDWQNVGVVGSRFNSGGANNGFGGLFINDLGYTGWFGNVSDERLKKDITPLESATDIILQLKPVTYYYKNDEFNFLSSSTEKEFGFIAQEVNEIIPEIVRVKTIDLNLGSEASANQEKQEDNQDIYMMDYTRLIPILTKAIQEQQETIESLNERIKILEAK
jgi:hypothetical protein